MFSLLGCIFLESVTIPLWSKDSQTETSPVGKLTLYYLWRELRIYFLLNKLPSFSHCEVWGSNCVVSWGEKFLVRSSQKTLKFVLFDTKKKIKSPHFLSLQCVAVSWINVHNRIEKADEPPFQYSIPKIVRMHQKLALFWRCFLIGYRCIGDCFWNQKLPNFLSIKFFYKVFIKSKLVLEENSYYMWMNLSLIVLSSQWFLYSLVTDLKTLSREDSFCKLNFVFALLLTYPSHRAETKIVDEQERFCLLV